MSAVKVSAVLVGLATYLDGKGVAAWRPTGTYGASEKAITLKALPAAPDAAVALSVYDVADDVVLPDVEVMVQLRFRSGGTRTAVDDFADSVFDVLHARHMLTAGQVQIGRAHV